MLRRLLGAAILASIAFTNLSCGGGALDSDQPDTDYVMFAGIRDGESQAAFTDVRCTSDILVTMDVEVDFAQLNPPQGGTRFDTFRLDRYIVTYKNLLTGSTAVGVPGGVPRPIEVHMSGIPQRVPATFELDNWPILLASQKNEPPLSDTASIGNGGIDYLATIEFWGRPEFSNDQWTRASFNFQFNVSDSGENNAPGCR